MLTTLRRHDVIQRTLRVLGVSIMTAFIALQAAQPALAEVELQNLNKPLSVQIAPGISEQQEPGASFQAILNEHHTYQNMRIPAGTRFSGSIEQRTESHHLARPGYIRISIQKAQLPSGATLTFNEEPESKVYHPDANTPKRAGMLSLPFLIVSSAVQMPLKYALGWGSGATIPLTIGSKMVVGVTREFIRDDKPKNRPAGHKIGYGLAVGTGIPGVCFILSKRPEPNFAAGENIEIYLQEDGLQQLFELSEQSQSASATMDNTI